MDIQDKIKGAKFGYDAIPKQYISGLVRKCFLMDISNKLENVMS